MHSDKGILKQFLSSRGCLSYIVADHAGGSAAIIDPSREIAEDIYRDFLQKHGLSLIYVIGTHTHADHISSSRELKMPGVQIVMHTLAPSPRVDVRVDEGSMLKVGDLELQILATPGHAPDHISLYVPELNAVFTGDTLLIEGTGRVDFSHSDPAALYESLQRLLTLPDEVRVYPGHEYKGRTHSTIGHERAYNLRLQLSREEFIHRLTEHRPPLPELYEISLKENRS